MCAIIMKMAQFKEDSNQCGKRRETQLRWGGGGVFLHQRRWRILPGALKQQLSVCPSQYSGSRDRDRRFPDSSLLSHKPPSPLLLPPPFIFTLSLLHMFPGYPQSSVLFAPGLKEGRWRQSRRRRRRASRSHGAQR